jgi:hypothetical protein
VNTKPEDPAEGDIILIGLHERTQSGSWKHENNLTKNAEEVINILVK